MGLLQHFGKESGCSTGKPVILKHPAPKHIQYAERVVHTFLTDIVEMISVIHTSKVCHTIFFCQTVPFCQPFQFRDEIGFNFRAGHTTKSIVLRVEADIDQLVESAEYTHLSKFGHSGDKDEAQPGVC